MSMKAAVAAGVTTAQLDEIAAEHMKQAGAVSGARNYPTYKPGEGFPGYTCISVNEEVVHGIPGPRSLKDGDVVTMDVASPWMVSVATRPRPSPLGPSVLQCESCWRSRGRRWIWRSRT